MDEQEHILTRTEQRYKDMQPVNSRLVRPEIRDNLPVHQLSDTFVILFECEVTKRIMSSEIYIDLVEDR